MVEFDFWNRVYINCGADFDVNSSNLDFEELLDQVAIHKRTYNGVPLVEEVEKNGVPSVHVYRGRTKGLIVHETNAFIAELQEVKSDKENMASFCSKRQINKLIRAFRGKKKRITAYALVIVYIMAVIILKNPCQDADDLTLLKDVVDCIVGWVRAYSAEYGDDELAVFLLDCANIVYKALQSGNPDIKADEFPYVPKQNPDDLIDC